MMKNKLKLPELKLKQKINFAGYVFTLPLIIGFLLFFLYPFILSISFSLSELKISSDGYELVFVGISNYHEIIMINPRFMEVFVNTILRTISDVPLVLGFSFFAAALLNQQFKGRVLARAIFFLPVILAAGVIREMEQIDLMTALLTSSEGAMGEDSFFSFQTMQSFLLGLRLPEALLNYILHALDHIPEIINRSGIQILIFLAGLQSIPSALYESAVIDGATAWEKFWKITFPLLTPLIMVNIVYTIVDFFTAADNELMQMINRVTFGGAGYGLGTAMSWLYFIFIIIFLGLIGFFISRKVFYYN